MRRGVAIAMAIALGTASAAARADMPARVAVTGQGGCPTAAAVARALERLHPALRAAVGGDGVRVEVVDGGAGYEVRAAGGVRRLADAERRCSERATAAALAATLLIAPPATPPDEAGDSDGPEATRETPDEPTPEATRETTSPSPPGAAATAPKPVAPVPPRATVPPANTTPANTTPAPAPTPAAAATVPVRAQPEVRTQPTGVVTRRAPATGRALSRIDLELVGLVDGAPALDSAASEVTGGAALRLTLGGRYLAGTLGVAGLAPATATSDAIDVGIVRVPFDLGLRLLLPLGRVEPGIDAGLALAVLRFSAPSLVSATQESRLDVGARIAPFLRVWINQRVGIVAGLQMVVSFAPYTLFVNGAGVIATTPRLWLGGGLGLVARL